MNSTHSAFQKGREKSLETRKSEITVFTLILKDRNYFFPLQNGVSPNFQFEDNLGPLHLAAKNGNTQCAFYLLQFNANPNMVSKVSKELLLYFANFALWSRGVSEVKIYQVHVIKHCKQDLETVFIFLD